LVIVVELACGAMISEEEIADQSAQSSVLRSRDEGLTEKASFEDVEAFLRTHSDVETHASQMLLALPPEAQKVVIDRGSLKGARDQTAVLITRMKNATSDGSLPVLSEMVSGKARRSRGSRKGRNSGGQAGVAIFDFDGTPHGEEYLSLTKGETIFMLLCRDEDEGWAYGHKTVHTIEGWFPPKYWKATTKAAELKVKLKPGKIGDIDADWQNGLVTFVDEAHEAHRFGVRVGMRFLTVAGKPYTKDRYDTACNSGLHVDFTFAQADKISASAIQADLGCYDAHDWNDDETENAPRRRRGKRSGQASWDDTSYGDDSNGAWKDSTWRENDYYKWWYDTSEWAPHSEWKTHAAVEAEKVSPTKEAKDPEGSKKKQSAGARVFAQALKASALQ